MSATTGTPGRNCPLGYRYSPSQLGNNPEPTAADVLYVIGGLYGNPFALAEIEALAARETAQGHRVELVFNGDFNWFNADPAVFEALNQRVLQHRIVLGNVEWELVAPQPDAGCGCGYPDSVDAQVVERSNRIIDRLKGVAVGFPDICKRLQAQPRFRCLAFGGKRVLVLHGDPESLAGWGLALEKLREPGHLAQLEAWLQASGANIIAATHTCSPALWRRGDRAIVNNGSAGMGNFVRDPRGLITRISAGSAHPDAILSAATAGLRTELVPLNFDVNRWQALFGDWWPAGTDAALSYGDRVTNGTHLTPADTLLGDLAFAAR